MFRALFPARRSLVRSLGAAVLVLVLFVAIVGLVDWWREPAAFREAQALRNELTVGLDVVSDGRDGVGAVGTYVVADLEEVRPDTFVEQREPFPDRGPYYDEIGSWTVAGPDGTACFVRALEYVDENEWALRVGDGNRLEALRAGSAHLVRLDVTCGDYDRP